ncbi:histidine phosphatase family protein [Candidatus Dojkabacteria bacterium]|nr:histidine phosphatase family protein [Candidatus Dojkabacteria bacterium]
MKIFLVRHGEAQDDIEDCYGGIADFQLSDLGRKTAKELALKLSNKGIAALYSSPYKRASETASIIASVIDCQVKANESLRERNSYGVLSGVNKTRAKDIFAHVLVGFTSKPGDYYSDELILGAEPIPEFDKRVKSAFYEITKDSESLEAIGIVTHGNVTRSIYKNILNIDGKIELGLLALTEIEYDNGAISIISSDGISTK